jgi:hypothetical protein
MSKADARPSIRTTLFQFEYKTDGGRAGGARKKVEDL